LRAEADGEELRAIGFGEIEVDIPRRGLMARGHHAEPLQRIGFIAGARLIEKAGGIGKLRIEFGDEICADFVAAGADGRAESGKEIGGFAAKFKAQAAHGLFGDTGEHALPTRMNGSDGALLGIDEKDWNAIGGLHGEKQAGTIRGGGVAFARVARRGGEKVNYVGVDLLERCERGTFRAKRGLQEAAIFSDIFGRIPFHEAEIENLPAIEKADATGPRAESVDEPREFKERRELQDLQAAGTAHHPGRQETQGARDGAFAD
jgi:hypothetical protein